MYHKWKCMVWYGVCCCCCFCSTISISLSLWGLTMFGEGIWHVCGQKSPLWKRLKIWSKESEVCFIVDLCQMPEPPVTFYSNLSCKSMPQKQIFQLYSSFYLVVTSQICTQQDKSSRCKSDSQDSCCFFHCSRRAFLCLCTLSWAVATIPEGSHGWATWAAWFWGTVAPMWLQTPEVPCVANPGDMERYGKMLCFSDFHYIQFGQIIVTDLEKSPQKVRKWDMFSNVEVGGVNLN